MVWTACLVSAELSHVSEMAHFLFLLPVDFSGRIALVHSYDALRVPTATRGQAAMHSYL